MARQNRPFNALSNTGNPDAPAPFGSSPLPGGPGVQVVRRPAADDIRKRAYELFCARKGQGGSPEQDWLRAERELSAKSTGR
ncbi:MAG: DUF2934 domain-containing protein [Phycisphaerales bacterium]